MANQTPEPGSRKKLLDTYVKYSGIGFQLVAIIIAGVYAGVKLDEYLKMSFPLFKLSLSLISVSFSMYYLIKKLSTKKE